MFKFTGIYLVRYLNPLCNYQNKIDTFIFQKGFYILAM